MFVAPNAVDAAFAYINDNVERLVVCSSEPASYAAVAGATLGDIAFGAADVSAPTSAGGGRQVTYAAKTDIAVDTSGTATHVALVDDTGTELLIVTSISNSQAVTGGNTMDTSAFTHTIQDPA
jgi:hypothetical protein